jgi:hypothetical protein
MFNKCTELPHYLTSPNCIHFRLQGCREVVGRKCTYLQPLKPLSLLGFISLGCRVEGKSYNNKKK